MKNACNMRSILFVSMDKKMISPHNEWYIGNVLVCAHFSSKLAHGTYCWLAVHGKPVLFWKGTSGLKFPCFLFMHANGTGPFEFRAVPIL